MAFPQKITFDLMNQTGNLLTIQKAFVQQASLEGWKPHEIAGVITESMGQKSLVPLAQYCVGITEPDLEALRARYVEEEPETAASHGPVSRVSLVDLDVPFQSLVVFMMKWALASIPAILVLSIVGVALKFVYTGFAAAYPR